jgi:hypothetical protein
MLLQILLIIQILLYQIQDTTFEQSVSEQLHQEKIKTAKCERVVSVLSTSMLFKNHKFRLADLLALSVNEVIFNVIINSTWDCSNDKLKLPSKYLI